MKRVRIMLAAIAVLGTFGGTLAFKARHPAPLYCIETTGATSGAFCVPLTPGYTIANFGPSNIRYTPTVNRANCSITTICPAPGFAIIE